MLTDRRHLRVALAGALLLGAGFGGSERAGAPNSPNLEVGLYLHGPRTPGGPSGLFIDPRTPISMNPRFLDSAAVGSDETGSWVDLATWRVDQILPRSTPEGDQPYPVVLEQLQDFRGWLALGPGGDDAASFDVQVELLRNDALLSSAVARCVTGLNVPPGQGLAFTASFDPFVPVSLAAEDRLEVRVHVRAGTGEGGGPCADGFSPSRLRLYYDAQSTASGLGAMLRLRPDGNRAPVADAGFDQTRQVGQQAQLDGSGSSDLDGDALTYAWSFVSKPGASSAALSDPQDVLPTFVVDVSGRYELSLIVNDGYADSDPDVVVVDTGNSPPVANAGADQKVEVTETVTLDGTGSTDVDGDALTYAWTLLSRPVGSAAVLDDPTSPMPSFVADVAGDFVARLVVNDGEADSDPATVTVTAAGEENRKPVAEAGGDQSVREGDLVTLDGSVSYDPEGQPLTYHWSLTTKPDGSAAEIPAPGDPSSPTATFVADLPGDYVAQLIVNDGELDSMPDTVLVTCHANTAPVANPGPDRSVGVGDTVTLDGTGSSDVDLDPLTFAWALLSKPEGSTATLNDPTLPNPSFVADLEGLYVVQLIVNDGELDSDPETATISAGVALPIAMAGLDQDVPTGFTVALDGTASTDPGSLPLSYTWSFVAIPAGSVAVLSDPASAQPTFVADVAGDYDIQLVVDNGTSPSAPDTVRVTVGAPLLDGVAPARVVQGETVPNWVLTGRRLQQATSIEFAAAGAVATQVAPSADGTRVDARLQVDIEAPIGPIGVTVVTPYGTSNSVSLLIEPKGLGWIGTYYDQFSQQDLDGLPIVPGSGALFQRTDASIRFGTDTGFAWHPCLLPGVVCVTGPFTVRWEGFIYLEDAGTYTFGVRSSDAAKLRIGGVNVVLNPGVHAPELATGSFQTDHAGSFAAFLEFDSAGTTAGIDLLYQPPAGAELVLVPPGILFNKGGAAGTDLVEASVSFFNPAPPEGSGEAPTVAEASASFFNPATQQGSGEAPTVAEASASFFNPATQQGSGEAPTVAEASASFFNPATQQGSGEAPTVAEASASFFNPELPPTPTGEASVAEASASVFNPEPTVEVQIDSSKDSSGGRR